MYCSKCGKEIDYEATVCNECLKAESEAQPEATYTYTSSYSDSVNVEEEKPQGSRMEGFKGALISTILGDVGFAVVYATLMVISGFMTSQMIGAIFMTVPFVLAGVAMCVIALVLGIKAIGVFKKATLKPIATLILGINGLACAAAGIVLALILGSVLLIALAALISLA